MPQILRNSPITFDPHDIKMSGFSQRVNDQFGPNLRQIVTHGGCKSIRRSKTDAGRFPFLRESV